MSSTVDVLYDVWFSVGDAVHSLFVGDEVHHRVVLDVVVRQRVDALPPVNGLRLGVFVFQRQHALRPSTRAPDCDTRTRL